MGSSLHSICWIFSNIAQGGHPPMLTNLNSQSVIFRVLMNPSASSLSIDQVRPGIYICICTRCDPPGEATRLLAAGCIALLGFINCYNVKWANMVQVELISATTIWRLLPPKLQRRGLVFKGKMVTMERV